jgi:hypothetical protein
MSLAQGINVALTTHQIGQICGLLYQDLNEMVRPQLLLWVRVSVLIKSSQIRCMDSLELPFNGCKRVLCENAQVDRLPDYVCAGVDPPRPVLPGLLLLAPST